MLTAIEAYQDLITVRFDDPDTLNEIMQTQADNLKHLTETYGLSPDMTIEDIQEVLGTGVKYRPFREDLTQRTTVIPRTGTGRTLKQMCSSMGSMGRITDAMEKRRVNSEVGQRARACAIQEYVEKACAEFSSKNSDYKRGEYHANHKRGQCKRAKRQREIINGMSGFLAHVEDVFERAYPERKAHKTLISATNMYDRANAEMIDENESIVRLAAIRGSVAAHELAHTLEGNFDTRQPYQQRIQEASTLTHLTRTGTKDVDLYSGGTEMALEDEYASAYTGKMYSDGSTELDNGC